MNIPMFEKIGLIKAVRAAANIGLREAKIAVETVIGETESNSEAQKAVEKALEISRQVQIAKKNLLGLAIPSETYREAMIHVIRNTPIGYNVGID